MDIKIFTTNDKIIDLERIIPRLSSAMQNQSPINVFLMSEGPCCEYVGIYQLLNHLCDFYSFDKKLISIETSNLCEHHDEYKIQLDFNYWELEKSRQNIKNLQVKSKIFDDKFKHFGNFIGHGNVYRLQLGSYLFNHHKEKTLQTYHYKFNDDYHKEFIGIEDMIHAGKPFKEIREAVFFLQNCPIKLDNIETYPILQPANICIGDYYHSFMVEIVNQTFFSGKIFYLDEKIWRPILLKTPFMVQGSKNFIVNLHKIGFKTFEKFWREDYSQDPHNCQVEPMMMNINKLSKLSVTDLREMYDEMRDILEHNFQLAMKISREDIQSIKFDV